MQSTFGYPLRIIFLLIALCYQVTAAGCSKPDAKIETSLPPPPEKDPETEIPAEPWKQKEFVLSTFYAVPGSGDANAYRTILNLTKAAGINLVELPFISPEALLVALNVAEEVGIKTLPQNQRIYSGIGSEAPPISEANIINEVKFLKRFTTMEGYYVWDEPFEADFKKVKDLNNILKKHDPSRLAFTVLFPSYGVYNWEEGEYNWENNTYAKYVNNYLLEVDPEVLSFNYYPYRDNKESTSLIENDLWKDFGYIRQKGLEYKKPLWFYFQAVSINPQEQGVMNLERIRAQMYGALAYGVKGLSYYTTHKSLLTETYVKSAMYDDLSALNKSVKNLGNLLLSKTSEYIYHSGIQSKNQEAYFLDNLEASDLIEGAPTGLIIGVLKGATAEKYVIISNKSHSNSVVGTLNLKKTVQISEYNPKVDQTRLVTEAGSSINLDIQPGEVAAYIIK